MEGFYLYLILIALIIAYTAVVILIYKKVILPMKEPDAVLSFTEGKDQVKGNFLLLLPIDEVRKRESIRVEIQNYIAEDESQEKQPL